MKPHTTVLYDRKNKAWRLWCEWSKRELASKYPSTGGCELFVHNWYVCNSDQAIANQAQEVITSIWSRWHEIRDRYQRLYDRSEHNQHIKHDEVGKYLWCDRCKASN